MLLQDVSVRTIQENIHTRLKFRKKRAQRKPFVSEVQRKNRLAFAHKYSSWTTNEWKRVLWNGESSFKVGDTKQEGVVPEIARSQSTPPSQSNILLFSLCGVHSHMGSG
ncbi:hypothetical protein Pcinc_021033 [Petrolisthes cinctipes]|uniref:Transposase Tc1-like domain-containing protein n=1 Tax=Petrolisthes cinctipes TaxID=88211 RepID=A0AAE1KKI5_PETCI|nr:hypothetical protein Pcinc_021033 [Petrolisthes cinctipes]